MNIETMEGVYKMSNKTKASVAAVLVGTATPAQQQAARNWLMDELADQREVFFTEDVSVRQAFSGRLVEALERLHFLTGTEAQASGPLR